MSAHNQFDDETVQISIISDVFNMMIQDSPYCLNKKLNKILKKKHINGFIITERLSFPIDRCRVGKSKIDGNGVFATRNIATGEIITFYPGDHLHINISGVESAKHRRINCIRSGSSKACDEDNNWAELLSKYKFSVDEQISIVGDPTKVDDPRYLGHMCNDGARSHSKEDIQLYIRVSRLKCNADFTLVSGCHVAITATKDIKEGEEILVTYGPGYWKSYYDQSASL